MRRTARAGLSDLEEPWEISDEGLRLLVRSAIRAKIDESGDAAGGAKSTSQRRVLPKPAPPRVLDDDEATTQVGDPNKPSNKMKKLIGVGPSTSRLCNTVFGAGRGEPKTPNKPTSDPTNDFGGDLRVEQVVFGTVPLVEGVNDANSKLRHGPGKTS